MAEMLLLETAQLGQGERAVLWAHNGHVTRSPLRYLSVDEPGIGGHAAARIGDAYYALGFAFGEGGFQANARDGDGRFGFRRYSLSAPPAGSLESVLVAARAGDWLVDLRSAPRSGPASEWLSRDHGLRWFGGYGVPDDCDEQSRDVASLPRTNLRADYGGLVFLARTTPAMPRDTASILESSGSSGG
jgi:erythromycin esterase